MAKEKVLVVDVHKSIVTKGISVRECVEDAFKVNLDRHPNVSKVVAVSKGKIVGAFDIAGYKRYKSGRTHIDTKPLYWKAKKEIEQKLNVKRKYGDRSAVRYKTLKK